MSVRLMGVLNVTPDSFSDGGRYQNVEAAVRHAEFLRACGADWVDVGGESTRPGAPPVALSEELQRVVPVVEQLAQRRIAVSVDTSKPEVAEAALTAGARLLNDVTGGTNPAIREAALRHGATICLMHMHRDPSTMMVQPMEGAVTEQVVAFLEHQARVCRHEGFGSDQIWIDPGIGFGKTTEQNLELIRELGALKQLGYPVLVGVSRKSFLGRWWGGETTPLPVDARGPATAVAETMATLNGADIIRTHDVSSTRRSLDFIRATQPSSAAP
jgi:dihydropteroate synthase